MSLLDTILENNGRYLENRHRPNTEGIGRRIALFISGDSRFADILVPAMGIQDREADVVGGLIIDPGVVRDLVLAIFVRRCEEVFVIGCRDSEVAQIGVEDLARRMIERGVARDAVAAVLPDLQQWLAGLRDPTAAVVNLVEMIQGNVLIPNGVPLHGMTFDPISGKLSLLVNGYDHR